MNDAINRLLGTRPEDIALDQAIVLDWYDGPREGFLRFKATSSAWHFRIIGSKMTEDDVDDRLYLLSKVPDDALERLVAAAGRGEQVTVPIWVPAWQFDTDAAREHADEVVEGLKRQREAAVITRSADLLSFQSLWRAE